MGARSWRLGQRNGHARGIFNRLAADDRFSIKEILSGSQYGLNALLSSGGRSAFQMVIGSNPAALFGRGVRDEDLMFAPATFLSGQSVQQWRLRGMARGAALKGMADSMWRRLLAHNRPFRGADVRAGDSALSCESVKRGRAHRRRSPAAIPDIDVTGVTVERQSRTFRGARLCVRRTCG